MKKIILTCSAALFAVAVAVAVAGSYSRAHAGGAEDKYGAWGKYVVPGAVILGGSPLWCLLYVSENRHDWSHFDIVCTNKESEAVDLQGLTYVLNLPYEVNKNGYAIDVGTLAYPDIRVADGDDGSVNISIEWGPATLDHMLKQGHSVKLSVWGAVELSTTNFGVLTVCVENSTWECAGGWPSAQGALRPRGAECQEYEDVIQHAITICNRFDLKHCTVCLYRILPGLKALCSEAKSRDDNPSPHGKVVE